MDIRKSMQHNVKRKIFCIIDKVSKIYILNKSDSELTHLLNEEVFKLNQNIDHVRLLTDYNDNGPTKYQFLLRQGWAALIYRDLRLRDKLKFTELASRTGYTSQMWRNLMKANYDVVDESFNKLSLVSDKFIETVTNSLVKHGYFIDTEKMVKYQKLTGAMVRMFWNKGKCTDVLIQNSAEGPDVNQDTRIAVNVKKNHIERLQESINEWNKWSQTDLQRWVLWSESKEDFPEIESKLTGLKNEELSFRVDGDKVIISVAKSATEPIKVTLTVERNENGELVVTKKIKGGNISV
jgi:hypothetical protein